MSQVPNLAEERETVLRAMLAGRVNGIASEEASRAVSEALGSRTEHGGRSVGFGVIQARPLYEGGDRQEFLVVVTDGKRQAAITVSLSGTQIAILQARGEPVLAHLLDRLQGAAGSLPNDGRRYDNLVLNHPIRL